MADGKIDPYPSSGMRKADVRKLTEAALTKGYAGLINEQRRQIAESLRQEGSNLDWINTQYGALASDARAAGSNMLSMYDTAISDTDAAAASLLRSTGVSNPEAAGLGNYSGILRGTLAGLKTLSNDYWGSAPLVYQRAGLEAAGNERNRGASERFKLRGTLRDLLAQRAADRSVIEAQYWKQQSDDAMNYINYTTAAQMHPLNMAKVRADIAATNAQAAYYGRMPGGGGGDSTKPWQSGDYNSDWNEALKFYTLTGEQGQSGYFRTVVENGEVHTVPVQSRDILKTAWSYFKQRYPQYANDYGFMQYVIGNVQAGYDSSDPINRVPGLGVSIITGVAPPGWKPQAAAPATANTNPESTTASTSTNPRSGRKP